MSKCGVAGGCDKIRLFLTVLFLLVTFFLLFYKNSPRAAHHSDCSQCATTLQQPDSGFIVECMAQDAFGLYHAGALYAGEALAELLQAQYGELNIVKTVCNYIFRGETESERQYKLLEALRADYPGVSHSTKAGSRSLKQGSQLLIFGGITPSVGMHYNVHTRAEFYEMVLLDDLKLRLNDLVVQPLALQHYAIEKKQEFSLASPESVRRLTGATSLIYLLYAEFLPTESGDRLFMRLSELDSGRSIGSFSNTHKTGESYLDFISDLAQRIADSISVQ